jgi:tRNA uridine 5-carboxymethylaminomethyl modification enzyme
VGLALAFEKIGFSLGRLRTGTPPRLLASSVDTSQLAPQESLPNPTPFSFLNDSVANVGNFITCYLTSVAALFSKNFSGSYNMVCV